jgi:Pentapeptide repeats (8 copies)
LANKWRERCGGFGVGTRGVILWASAIAVSGFTLPVLAEGQPNLEQLVQRKFCEGCDLSRSNLKGLNLSGINLKGANLNDADLSGADLSGADLTGASLERTNLSNARLNNTNLSGINLETANLAGTNLAEANLAGASIEQPPIPSAVSAPAPTSTVSFETPLRISQNPKAPSSASDLKSGLTPASTESTSLLAQEEAEPTQPAPDTSSATTETPTPLELPPIRLFNLETANQLPRGALSFSVGLRNFLNSQGPFGGGFGKQVNPFRVDYGITDRLQIGLAGDLFSDRLNRPVLGQPVEFQYFSAAAQLKYKVFEQKNFSVGVTGSAELLNLRSNTTSFLSGVSLGNEKTGGNIIVGSVQVPLTYSVTDKFQLHLTPGVSFFPETFQGAPFYGTIFNVGAGVSWQPLKRLNFFADVHVPIGPGGNAIRGSDASVFKAPVWSGGLRFLVNPAVGLDIYATNAFGTTPAAQTLSFLPDSDQIAIAALLNFTPDLGKNYAADFRGKPRVDLTARDKQLLMDGFTIPTADTLRPRTLRVRGGYGAGINGNIATGLTNDVQLEFLALAYDGPIANGLNPEALKLGGAAKIRFLDQVQGDPFSLAARATFAQTVTERNGFSEGGLIFQYRPIPQLALLFEPKAGVFGGDERFGTGLGVNLQLWKGLQFIGEYTPVFVGQDKTGVWSVGLRYVDAKTGLGVDVYSSNAAGLDSFGTLIGRPDPSIGFNVHWLFEP